MAEHSAGQRMQLLYINRFLFTIRMTGLASSSRDIISSFLSAYQKGVSTCPHVTATDLRQLLTLKQTWRDLCMNIKKKKSLLTSESAILQFFIFAAVVIVSAGQKNYAFFTSFL